MLPLVRQLRRRGHDVLIATAPTMARDLESRGLPTISVGPDWHQSGQRLAAEPKIRHRDTAPGTPFLVRAADDALDELVRASRRWKPDVIVRDSTAYAGWIAAEILQIPHATWAITLRTPGALLYSFAAPVIDQMLHRYRLPPDPDLSRLEGSLYFDVFPRGFRPAWWPDSRVSFRVRPGADDLVATLPSWVTRRKRPLVHVTLGTVPYPSGDLLQKVVSACGTRPVDVLVAAGHHRLGPLPGNTHLVTSVSHSRLFRHCDVIINHAGPGVVLKSLAAGVPQLLLPLAADQPATAYCCSLIGVGLSAAVSPRSSSLFPVANGDEISSRRIGRQLDRLLDEPGFSQRARVFRRRIRTMPTVAAAARQLEGLCR
jgi:UDP:flavonoid glycosyltransferase YjiC (YdhE family)